MEEAYESFMSAWKWKALSLELQSIATAFLGYGAEYLALCEPWLEGLNWLTPPLPVVPVT